MKRIFVMMMILSLLCGVCGVMPAVAATDEAITLDAQNVTVLGRAEVTDHGIAVYTTGAGIAFYADGAGDMTLTVSASRLKSYTVQCFGVFVDGVRQERVTVDGIQQETTATVTVAQGLEAGLHRVEIVRETEETYGSCVMEAIGFDGTLSPVAASPLLIEFVGDSLTCGYASNTADDPDKGKDVEHPLWEVGTQTYAYRAAAALGADFQSVCASGYGVAAGWNADRVTLPDMYGYASYYHSDNKWSFERQADVIVINLGSNDNSRKGIYGLSDEDVVAKMKAFMEQVREKNPDAVIVWASGLDGTHFSDGLKASIAELGGEDAGYYYCELPKGTSGGAGHPSLEEHAAAGDALVTFLTEKGIVADYQEALVSVETAKEALDQLDGADKEKLALECAIAADSDALTGKLTGLYNTLNIQAKTASAFPWGALAAVGAAVVCALLAVVTALVMKNKK